MFVHADPDLVIKYSRAYREKYPWLKNQDGGESENRLFPVHLRPLEGMRGTGVFFITPERELQAPDVERPRNAPASSSRR